MKKLFAVLLAITMVLALVAVAACQHETTIRVTVYETLDSTPRAYNHVLGKDDLPTVTNGDLVFDGWYYDKAYTKPFDPVKDTDITEGTVLYAKWKTAGSSADEVRLTLDPDYTGSKVITYYIAKNSTYNLPSFNRNGYTFGGWYTERNGDGIKWTNTSLISEDLTLYAYWTSGGGNTGGNDNLTPVDLSATLNKYGDTSNWNFSVTVTVSDSSGSYDDYYEYLGDLVLNKYEGSYGGEYIDYYDMSDYAVWYYYGDDGNGEYSKYDDTSDEFLEAYSYSLIIDLYMINNYEFASDGDHYIAIKSGDLGNAIFGEYEGYTWTSVSLYIANNNISKLVGVLSDGSTSTYVFGKYGQINFTLPDATEGGSIGGDLPTEPTGTMENQVYNPETFDNKNLQQKMEDSDDIIGLPSTGTYNALVIPVQFKGDTITDEQLNNLNVAFNGTSAQTGWESVASFYQKSSYGKLNLTFDITDVYQANNNASYYSKYNGTFNYSDGTTAEKDGSSLILEEALAWCVTKGIDLSKYDTNNDGCIDAVYLIYSEEVDYNADFYWAYVTWYYGETKYDGLDAYYYLFAGFGFMDEKVDANDSNGLKINAETYIHETGHLLGLDDYYDYETSKGSNQGLGGADMMDWNEGDHGVYSKIMLGWMDPTIVTSTQTITIKSSQEGGYAILIPLNFNNSYFCEYLLIDLYTATGLNEMASNKDNTVLYDGAEYGVRIYHVTSWVNDPYNNSFGSFTDCNNSTSNIPLIKLVEADGQTSTSSSSQGGWASKDDLWQAGDTFSSVFSQYMRNDGKLLNFNITMDSVSADSATITITYNESQAA